MVIINVHMSRLKFLAIIPLIIVCATLHCCAHPHGYHPPQGRKPNPPMTTYTNNPGYGIQPFVSYMDTENPSLPLDQLLPTRLDNSFGDAKQSAYNSFESDIVDLVERKHTGYNWIHLPPIRTKRQTVDRNNKQPIKSESFVHDNGGIQSSPTQQEVPIQVVKSEKSLPSNHEAPILDAKLKEPTPSSYDVTIAKAKLEESSAIRDHPDSLEDSACKEHLLLHNQQCNNQDCISLPCPVEYGHEETTVRCSGLSLTTIDPALFPKNATTILLDNNNLESIPNMSFCHLSYLRHLSFEHNSILFLESKAFSGLRNLISLNLEYNPLLLDLSSFPSGIFSPLRHLQELRIGRNHRDTTKVILKYPRNFLTDLKNLTTLSINAVGETLHFDEEFRYLEKLTRLEVSHGEKTKFIADNSFENVKHLTYLEIGHLHDLAEFSPLALEPLQMLKIFRIISTHIGTTKALNTLQPLATRNATMTSIYFRQIYIDQQEAIIDFSHGDSVLDSAKTKFLRNICVEHFTLRASHVVEIESNSLISDKLRSCLKSIDFSDNALIDDIVSYFRGLQALRSLEVITWKVDSYEFPYRLKPTEPEVPQYTDLAATLDPLTPENEDSHNSNFNTSQLVSSFSTEERNHSDAYTGATISTEKVCKAMKSTTTLYITCPPSLTVVTLRNTGIKTPLNLDVYFRGGQNLIYLDISGGRLEQFTNYIFGLTSLKTLVLSGNDLSVLSESFFDSLCHLEELFLSDCFLEGPFMSLNSARLFLSLSDLKRLDLSSNHLSSFSFSTFSSNTLLEELNLAVNDFRNVPFGLRNTPNLRRLDLKKNAITSLDTSVTREMDKLAARPGGFYLDLAENILSCECSTILFLDWLQTTNVVLDKGRNFTCMTDQGQLSSTGAFSDLKGLWRKCWGKFFLSLASCLFMLTILGFLAFFLVWKNETLLKSWILRVFGGYVMKRPEDYPIGVHIGYADNDYRFVCYALREFIEDTLRLKCYIRDRDMIPGPDEATSITEAINTSWRTVLVVTRDFLSADDWTMFTMTSAIYAQSPDNPARVVVIVEDTVLAELPPMLLHAVSEDNLIVVADWQMTYDVRETLRTRLTTVV